LSVTHVTAKFIHFNQPKYHSLEGLLIEKVPKTAVSRLLLDERSNSATAHFLFRPLKNIHLIPKQKRAGLGRTRHPHLHRISKIDDAKHKILYARPTGKGCQHSLQAADSQ
jgi:hypothetical protein